MLVTVVGVWRKRLVLSLYPYQSIAGAVLQQLGARRTALVACHRMGIMP